MIVLKLRKGLSKDEKARILGEAIFSVPGCPLVGKIGYPDTGKIELEEPAEVLPVLDHYAMMMRLDAIDGVEGVWLDNGARAEPGGGTATVTQKGGGLREFIRSFLCGARLDDF